MNPIHILLHPESAGPMPALTLDASVLPCGGGHKWSVRTQTLRGGTQEGVDVVWIENGRLSFAVLPTRGMGLWKGRCGEVALGWESPVRRPVHPAFVPALENGGIGWLRGFNEWIVRCGLASMGAPGTDTIVDNNGNPLEAFLPLHGNIANLPAHSVSVEISADEIILRGEVDETMMFGPALRLATEMRTAFGSNAIQILDTVTNLGDQAVEHQLLYHVNQGRSILEEGARLHLPFRQMAPRDARAAEGVEDFTRFDGPVAGFVEQAYFFEPVGDPESGETLALLANAAEDQGTLLRFSLRDFPCFTLWKNTAGMRDGYVAGLEPGTSYPNTRKFERQQGRVPVLGGGESRRTRLVVEVLEGAEGVKAARAEIEALHPAGESQVHRRPIGDFSAL